jgi:hypothetical protein
MYMEMYTTSLQVWGLWQDMRFGYLRMCIYGIPHGTTTSPNAAGSRAVVWADGRWPGSLGG